MSSLSLTYDTGRCLLWPSTLWVTPLSSQPACSTAASVCLAHVVAASASLPSCLKHELFHLTYSHSADFCSSCLLTGASLADMMVTMRVPAPQPAAQLCCHLSGLHSIGVGSTGNEEGSPWRGYS